MYQKTHVPQGLCIFFNCSRLEILICNFGKKVTWEKQDTSQQVQLWLNRFYILYPVNSQMFKKQTDKFKIKTIMRILLLAESVGSRMERHTTLLANTVCFTWSEVRK